MSNPENDSAWEAATWEGSRRAQLRRALELTVRQRLEALEALSETSASLADLRSAVRRTSSAAVRKRADRAAAEVRERPESYDDEGAGG